MRAMLRLTRRSTRRRRHSREAGIQCVVHVKRNVVPSPRRERVFRSSVGCVLNAPQIDTNKRCSCRQFRLTASHFLLLRQKKVTKEKATPTLGLFLRCSKKSGTEKTRFAQTVFCSDRFFLALLGANQRGPIEPIFDRFAMRTTRTRMRASGLRRRVDISIWTRYNDQRSIRERCQAKPIAPRLNREARRADARCCRRSSRRAVARTPPARYA